MTLNIFGFRAVVRSKQPFPKHRLGTGSIFSLFFLTLIDQTINWLMDHVFVRIINDENKSSVAVLEWTFNCKLFVKVHLKKCIIQKSERKCVFFLLFNGNKTGRNRNRQCYTYDCCELQKENTPCAQGEQQLLVNIHTFAGKPAPETQRSPVRLLDSVSHLTTSCWLLPFQVIYYWLIFWERMWQTDPSGPPGVLYSVPNLHLEACSKPDRPQCS